MDSVWGIIGVIVFGCGIYAFYSYVKMKNAGEINVNLLLGKDYENKKCKDKEAYTKKAAPALLIFGVAAVLYGGIDIVHCYVYPIGLADMIAMIVFFVVLVWFGIYTTQLKKKYF